MHVARNTRGNHSSSPRRAAHQLQKYDPHDSQNNEKGPYVLLLFLLRILILLLFLCVFVSVNKRLIRDLPPPPRPPQPPPPRPFTNNIRRQSALKHISTIFFKYRQGRESLRAVSSDSSSGGNNSTLHKCPTHHREPYYGKHLETHHPLPPPLLRLRLYSGKDIRCMYYCGNIIV